MKNELIIAGIDEAGRGPLAGPVTVAGVILPREYRNSAIKDSKKLSPKQRLELSQEIKKEALFYSIRHIGSKRIDSINIRNATKLGMMYVAKELEMKTSQKIHFLIDGDFGPDGFNFEAIIKGDTKVLSISAASILAKVERDQLMQILSKKYPIYLFGKHSGYGTKLHQDQIRIHGCCRIHRSKFVRNLLSS